MNKLTLEQIELNHYFMPVMESAANPEHDPNEETMTMFAVNTRIDETSENNRFGVSVDVQSNQEESTNPPYLFRMSGVAFLTVNAEEFDPENAKQACFQIGHQILFGAIREQLTQITGRGPWNALQLRIVSAPEYVPDNKQDSQD